MDRRRSYFVLAGQSLRAGRRLHFLATLAGARVFTRRLGCRVGGKRHRAHVSEPVGRGVEHIAIVAGQAARVLRDRLRQ